MIFGGKKIARCVCAGFIVAEELVGFCKVNRVSYIWRILFGCLEEASFFPSEGASFLHYLAASCKVFGDSYSAPLGNLIDTVIDLNYFNKTLFPSPFGVLSSCQSSQWLWLFIAVSHKAL